MSTASSSRVSRKTAGSSKGTAAVSCTQRLQQELMNVMMSDTPGVSAFPADDSSICDWIGTVEGTDGTPYEGLTCIFIHFSSDYPMSAPTIKFEPNAAWHPNIALPTGELCLDVLKENWSAALSVPSILVSLRSLLGDPNPASPLSVDAADLYKDPKAYKAAVLKWHAANSSV